MGQIYTNTTSFSNQGTTVFDWRFKNEHDQHINEDRSRETYWCLVGNEGMREWSIITINHHPIPPVLTKHQWGNDFKECMTISMVLRTLIASTPLLDLSQWSLVHLHFFGGSQNCRGSKSFFYFLFAIFDCENHNLWCLHTNLNPISLLVKATSRISVEPHELDGLFHGKSSKNKW